MKTIYLLVAVILFSTQDTFSQLYQGPANGSVPSGVIVNTGAFNVDISGEKISPYIRKPRNKETQPNYPDYLNNIKPTGPEGSNYVENNRSENSLGINDPMLLKSFTGLQDLGSYIPSDTYIATGPTHVVGVDNSRFRIWDKNGNTVATINTDSWFSSALTNATCFDPKISYDHFGKRWIMVWLDQESSIQRGYFLISVSDDSIPLGTWYNWAIKSSLNGPNESGTWGDYQGVGFDNQAIYLTSRSFGFSGGYSGMKFRIIGKAQLYNNTAGPLVWTDFWDLRDPGNNGLRPDFTRPSIIYGNPGEYYFITIPPFFTSTYVIIYKLTNPLTSPVLTGVNIPVVEYSRPPNADQLGGSTILIETFGESFKNEPIYRNGSLYATHPVASGGGTFSAINYLKINMATNTATEDAAFGETGFWHYYPALAVDKDSNIAMTFSRSGFTAYIGANFNTKAASDPPATFSGIRTFKAGEANYVKDFGSGRNRWGDYNGIWVDPSDENNFWMYTNYAKLPANTWSNQVALIRVVPFSTARVFSSKDTLNFGTKEITTNSDTLSLVIYNFGSPVLNISNIQNSNSQFSVLNPPSFPLNINSRDSIILSLFYRPTTAGNLKDSLKISSNDPVNPLKTIYLNGKGFVINPAQVNTIYGVTGSVSGGMLLTINATTGVGTSVGASGFSQLYGVSIRPSNNQIYAIFPGIPLEILRVNASGGDAYPFASIPISNIRSIAFDTDDMLYGTTTDGKLYKYNLTTFDTSFIGNTGISNLLGLSLNPVNRSLWGMSSSGVLYKINKQTAASQSVGNTGITPNTDIAFSSTGMLYGLAGIGVVINRLISIDTANGAGTLIGTNIGIAAINGISISPNTTGIQNITTNIPDKYELYQNYPNPFNPATSIKFDLPNSVKVKLVVYDMLGKEIATLVNEKLEAGSYSYKWSGVSLSSGVYFYNIEAGNFITTKRMILLK